MRSITRQQPSPQLLIFQLFIMASRQNCTAGTEEALPLPPLTPRPLHYYSSFYLFNSYESELLYSYKYFIQNMILKLGEDWRIEANLLSQEIVAIRNASDGKDHSSFSLFNEFLSAYLRDKIGREYEHTNYSESEIQKRFLETVTLQFTEEKIHNGLTFKTLSLGYCITATEVWNKTFRNPIDHRFKNLITLKPFAKLSLTPPPHTQATVDAKNDNKSAFAVSSVRRKLEKFDIMSSRLSNSEFGAGEGEGEGEAEVEVEGSGQGQGVGQSARWQPEQEEAVSERECRQIKATLQKIPHSLKKTQVLSYFVHYVDEFHLKSGKTVRVFSIANEFYLNAFIFWLIFNIKMFFALSFEDYLRYFRELTGDSWSEEFERPLRKFQLILEREWHKLLKDFTVALHDDQEVLNILVERVRKCIQAEWQAKIASLKESFQLAH